MSKITAPFSEIQVSALNAWQQQGAAHPFTCPTHSSAPLAAATNGWNCSIEGCGYKQDWAHDFMAAAKFCTKEQPCNPAAPETAKEYWIHVDAVETCPEYEGEIVAYHCPNCGLNFDVDFR